MKKNFLGVYTHVCSDKIGIAYKKKNGIMIKQQSIDGKYSIEVIKEAELDLEYQSLEESNKRFEGKYGYLYVPEKNKRTIRNLNFSTGDDIDDIDIDYEPIKLKEEKVTILYIMESFIGDKLVIFKDDKIMCVDGYKMKREENGTYKLDGKAKKAKEYNTIPKIAKKILIQNLQTCKKM